MCCSRKKKGDSEREIRNSNIEIRNTVEARKGKMTCRAICATLVSLLSCTAAPVAENKPAIVYTFDARPLNRLDLRLESNITRHWDTLQALAALQGLANRRTPTLYLFYCAEFGVETDQFWFDWLRTEDGWLKTAEVRKLSEIEEVFRTLRSAYKGLAVWDPAVPATSNLASTAAGCDDLLPVRYDPRPGSIYDVLARRLKVPVALWLLNEDGTSKFTGKGKIPGFEEGSSGSAKADAYRWALRKYVASGRCGPGIAAYYLDGFWLQHPRRAGPTMHTLSNHDYFVARRAFFFDLSPWGDEPPTDDPGQPPGLDRKVFLEVLAALYARSTGSVLQVGGFPPWPYKYTVHAQPKGGHEGVPTEWEFGRLISQFNGYMEADAAGLGAMANASFYSHYPLRERYAQPNPKPKLADWQARGFVQPDGHVASRFYVGHYVGDYDAPSWLYKGVPVFFRDAARGKVPLGWAFDPSLADRAPQALAYAYRNAGSNDFLIAGDSGAGYLNPRALSARPESGLPSGLRLWAEHCRRHYARWDMTITGFMLDGSAGPSTDLEYGAYRVFSPDGIGTHFTKAPALRAGVSTCPERDLPDEADKAAALIAELAQEQRGSPGFLWARSILKSPSWYAQVSDALRKGHPDLEIEVVDPYTFFGLIGVAESKRVSGNRRPN
jgi:hypothetical protein